MRLARQKLSYLTSAFSRGMTLNAAFQNFHAFPCIANCRTAHCLAVDNSLFRVRHFGAFLRIVGTCTRTWDGEYRCQSLYFSLFSGSSGTARLRDIITNPEKSTSRTKTDNLVGARNRPMIV